MKIPPKFREFVAGRIGAWPKAGDINVDFVGLNEAMADYMDMLAAQAFGVKLEDDEA
jgi:hypothetical protein